MKHCAMENQIKKLIYAIDPNELTIPTYIDEGLAWLQTYLDPEE